MELHLHQDPLRPDQQGGGVQNNCPRWSHVQHKVHHFSWFYCTTSRGKYFWTSLQISRYSGDPPSPVCGWPAPHLTLWPRLGGDQCLHQLSNKPEETLVQRREVSPAPCRQEGPALPRPDGGQLGPGAAGRGRHLHPGHGRHPRPPALPPVRGPRQLPRVHPAG